MDLFDAARRNDIRDVRRFLKGGADVAAVNELGFTALQCAALGADCSSVDENLAVLRLLIAAGSPLEATEPHGRTALYLAAERASTVDAVKLLIKAGARADIFDWRGNHVVVNAGALEIKQLLSKVTGKPIPAAAPPQRPSVSLTAAGWKMAKAALGVAFDRLEEAGIVVLRDAASTQAEGFLQCSDIHHERGARAKLRGFCFFTVDDVESARRAARLPLAFWGAPAGKPAAMKRVGELVVDAMRAAGLDVEWNGSPGIRPVIYLHGYAAQKRRRDSGRREAR